MVDAGGTDGPPPWILVRALIARTFGVLPSQLDKEDAEDIMRAFSVINLYETAASTRKVR